MGDDRFNFVRTEPQLNTAIPGDERDTTTPVAMALSLQKLSLGTALDKNSKRNCKNGSKPIRLVINASAQACQKVGL